MSGDKPITTELDKLPDLIQRAMATLEAAQSSAEVLDARDAATYAYDAAKAAERLAKARGAHDAILAACYKTQAEALLIESRAKIRLAEEYTAAQERGEVAKRGDIGRGQNRSSRPEHLSTAADVGLTGKQVHEARQLLDGERRIPGVIKRTLEAMVDAGKAPTRAAVERAVRPKPPPPQSPQAKPDHSVWAEQVKDLSGAPDTNTRQAAPSAALQAEIDKLKAEIDKLKAENASLKNTKGDAALRKEVEKLRKELAEAHRELDGVVAKETATGRSFLDSEGRLRLPRLPSIEEVARSRGAEIRRLERELDNTRAASGIGKDIEAAIGKLNTEVAKVTAERDKVKEQVTKLEATLADDPGEAAKLLTHCNALRTRVRNLKRAADANPAAITRSDWRTLQKAIQPKSNPTEPVRTEAAKIFGNLKLNIIE